MVWTCHEKIRKVNGKRSKGRQERRWMDSIKNDLTENGLSHGDD